MLRLHFLDDRALLFDERRQQIYALDRAAAFIWCCIEEKLGPSEIARRLAELADVPIATADGLVEAGLREWRAQGLIGGMQTHDLAPVPVTAFQSAPQYARPQVQNGALRRVGALQFLIAGLGVRLRCAVPRVARRVYPAFAHLAAVAPGDRVVTIEARRMPRGYVIAQDGLPVARPMDLEGLVPAIKAVLVQSVLAQADYRLAIHAAALARHDRALLLPGISGSGKTTLAAALIANGFAYLGDDTVVLERRDLSVRPVPFALAVKSGAWSLLAPYHPDLLTLPVDRRPDGKKVRYLRPGLMARASLPAKWIVFPSWREGGRAELKPLDRVEALRRLLLASYSPVRRLAAADVAQLTGWIAELECYELAAAQLPGAVHCLRQLCG